MATVGKTRASAKAGSAAKGGKTDSAPARKPKSEKVRLTPDRDWFESARARDALKRTWKELAPEMGLDAPMLTRTLSGERGMTLLDLVAFARVLHVAVLDVLRHSGVDLRGVRLVGESDADPTELARRIQELHQQLQSAMAQRDVLMRLVGAQLGRPPGTGSDATPSADVFKFG